MTKRRDRRIMTKKPHPGLPILSVGECEGQKVLGIDLTREMIKELYVFVTTHRASSGHAMIPIEFLDAEDVRAMIKMRDLLRLKAARK